MDGGTDSTNIVTSRGNVSVPQLDCYYDNGACATRPEAPPEVVQNLAHSYGEITRGQLRCPYDTDNDIHAAPQNCTYFSNTASSEFGLRFAEYNPKDRAHSYPYFTDRVIKASASDCHQYQVRDKVDLIDSTDGQKETWVFHFFNETYNGSLPVPRPSAAFDSTTYVYNGISVPQNATVQSCGPRCISLWAFRSGGIITKRPSTMFQCSVNVGQVSNVTNDAHRIPDTSARLAAASIALTGRYTNPNNSATREWRQYQLFPFGYVYCSTSFILQATTSPFIFGCPECLFLTHY